MYKNILFDLDGAVIDSREVTVEGLQRLIYIMYGKWYEAERFSEYNAMHLPETLEKLGIENGEELIYYLEDYVKRRSDRFKYYYGIVTVLKVLKKAHISMSLVTGRSRAAVEADPHLKTIMPYFEGIICLNEASFKSNRVSMAIDAQGYQTKETLYVGNSTCDYESCLRVGVDFGKATWGYKLFEIANENHVFRTPMDILRVM